MALYYYPSYPLLAYIASNCPLKKNWRMTTTSELTYPRVFECTKNIK